MAGVWGDFATIAGSASGALTGLLFVAVSINRDRVTAHPALRSQAGQTLVLFLLPLIISIALVVPGTPHSVLGLELVVIAVVAGCIELAGDDGLYWLAPAVIIALVNGVVNAWLFLTR